MQPMLTKAKNANYWLVKQSLKDSQIANTIQIIENKRENDWYREE